MPNGKRLNRTAKNIIFSVYSYFEEQHRKSKVHVATKLLLKTAQATGYSVPTAERVVAMKRAISEAAFQSPVKRYTASMARIVLDDFDTEAIRRIYYSRFLRKGVSNIEEKIECAEGERSVPWASYYPLEVAT